MPHPKLLSRPSAPPARMPAASSAFNGERRHLPMPVPHQFVRPTDGAVINPSPSPRATWTNWSAEVRDNAGREGNLGPRIRTFTRARRRRSPSHEGSSSIDSPMARPSHRLSRLRARGAVREHSRRITLALRLGQHAGLHLHRAGRSPACSCGCRTAPARRPPGKASITSSTRCSGGWLLRGIHHFTAQAMVVLLVLHLMQVVIDGAIRPRAK